MEPDGGIVDQMWEKISQTQPLLGMSTDEVFITFQNLQLAANLPYGLLNMNVEIKIFIDTDTKEVAWCRHFTTTTRILRVFLSCANYRLCYLNLAGITKLKCERKNEKNSGRSSKITLSGKWPIRVALRHIKGEKGSFPVGVRHPKTALRKLFIIYTWTVADPGEGLGPLLLLDQTKAQRAEKTFLETTPTYLRVWMTAPPPPPPPPPRYLKVCIRHCMNVPDNRDGGSWNLLTFLTHGLCFRELFYAFYLAGMKSLRSMTFWHPK